MYSLIPVLRHLHRVRRQGIRSEHKAVCELQPPHQLDFDRSFGLLGVHRQHTDGFDGRKYSGKWLVEVLRLISGLAGRWPARHHTQTAKAGTRNRVWAPQACVFEGRRGAPQGGVHLLPYCAPFN